MGICGYLVFTEDGATPALAARLTALPGCDVVRAERRDLLLLVTESTTADEEAALRETLEEMEGVSALVLTFGEIDPETPVGDPLGANRGKNRRLPVIDP